MDAALPVVVMTAWGSVELAVEAMRRGARDFVPKPWKNERLLAILRTQVELGRALRKGRQLEQENTYLREEVADVQAFGDLVGQSPALRAVEAQIELVAPTEANVLILGESGTGKELVAREIHRRSGRSDDGLRPVTSPR